MMKMLRKASYLLVTLCIALGMAAAVHVMDVQAAEEVTFAYNGYAVGQINGNSITLSAELASGTASSVQWYRASAKNGTYSAISNATSLTYSYTDSNQSNSYWYKCKVNGSYETLPVQVVYKSANTTGWYVSNGSIAYTMTSTNFDVIGLYSNRWISAVISNSYWKWDTTNIQKLVFTFNPGNDKVIGCRFVLKDGSTSAKIGADVKLDGNDNAPVSAILTSNNTKLKQLQMVNASSLSAATGTEAAFVINCADAPTTFYIGVYSAANTEYNKATPGYNTGSDGTRTNINGTNVVTSVSNIDSGVCLYWSGITDGAVDFDFSIGTAADAGAEGGNIVKSIPSVAITDITAPVATSALDTTGACASTGVSTTAPSVTWTDVTNGGNTAATNAGYNKTYKASMTLSASSGYAFKSTTTATVNGKTATATLSGSNLIVTYTFAPTDKEEISAVAVADIADPVGGSALDTTASCGTTGVSTASAVTWKDASNTDVTTAGYNKVYTASVTLTPDADHKFTASTTAQVNSNDTNSVTLNEDGTLTVKYTFGATAKEAIAEVAITDILAPEATKALDDKGACATVGVSTTAPSVTWTDVTGTETAAPATAGYNKTYKASVTLTAGDDYKFTNTTTATVNTKTETSVELVDESTLKVTYTFAPTDKEAIGAVNITGIATPEATKALTTQAACADTGVSTTAPTVTWTDVTGGGSAEATGNAGYNKTYKASVTLTASGDYKFTDTTSATVNGKSGVVAAYTADSITVTYTFGATDKEAIGLVEITGIETPVAPNALDKDGVCGTTGVQSASAVTWTDDSGNSATGNAGYVTVYTASITLTADTDYKFTDGTRATVNGANAVISSVEAGTITVTYTFDKTDKEVINAVAVTDITTPKELEALDDKAACADDGITSTTPTITWSPADTTAAYFTAYTASVTLTSDDAHKFTSKTTATVNTNAATEVTLVNESTLTVTYTFAKTDMDKVVAPTASVTPGTYTSDQSVTLSTTTPGATIYYTTDGTTPTKASTEYTGAVAVTGRPGESLSTTIKAIAVKTDMYDSAVAEFAYTIEIPRTEIDAVEIKNVTIPAATEALGTTASCSSTGVSNTSAVTWSPADTTAAYFTVYTASVTLTADSAHQFTDTTTATVNGQSARVEKLRVDTLKVTFTFDKTDMDKVAAPTASVAADTYESNQSVTLSTTTPDATIYYTTDGTKPTTSSTVYTEAISITGSAGLSKTTAINAIAVKTDMYDSDVATYSYTIEIPKDEIASITISDIDTPEVGVELDTTASCTDTGVETVSGVTWTNGSGQEITGNADYNTSYTASITLTPDVAHKFTDDTNVTVNGNSPKSVTVNADGTLTVTYTFDATEKDTAVKPSADVEGGVYTTNQSITLTTSTPDATIYYTTDGSDPTDSGTAYNEPVAINGTEGKAVKITLKAITVRGDMHNSAVSTWTYIIRLAAGDDDPDDDDDKKVDIGKGDLRVDSDNGEGVLPTELSTPASEVKDILAADGTITDEELADVEAGETDIEIVLGVTDNEDTLDTEVKERIDTKAEEEGLEIAKYMDITLTKYVIPAGSSRSDVRGEKITVLSNGSISVTITIPEELQNTNPDKIRTYYVLRYHDEEIDILEGTTNGDGTEFTFTTDRFSPYVLAYKDSDRPEEYTPHHCNHTYEWEVYKKATATDDGIMRYRCTKCGDVDYEVPVTAYYMFNKDTQEAILKAAPGATVTTETALFISFHDMVKEALVERPDVTLVVDYRHAGKNYEMTIPAGSADELESLFGDSQFAGFLYLGGTYETTELPEDWEFSTVPATVVWFGTTTAH